MSRLIIVSLDESLHSALRLRKLGTFWGCDTELVSIDSNSTDAAVDLRSIKGESAIALSADTLIYCCKNAGLRETVHFLQKENGSILIYDWRAQPSHIEAIREITNGRIAAIKPIVNVSPFRVPNESQEFTNQLAGSEYFAEKGDCETGFDLRATKCESVALLTRGELCTFVRLKAETGTLFLASGAGIIDIDETASHQDAFDNLIWPTFDTFIWPTLGS